MTEIERILDQLKRAYEGQAWHGPSVCEVLAGVTADQAHARPLANAHSIWELVRHLAVWEDVGRRRLEGDRAQIDISSPEDWPPADDPSEAAWEQAKAALDRGHQALRVPVGRLGLVEARPSPAVDRTGHCLRHDARRSPMLQWRPQARVPRSGF